VLCPWDKWLVDRTRAWTLDPGMVIGRIGQGLSRTPRCLGSLLFQKRHPSLGWPGPALLAHLLIPSPASSELPLPCPAPISSPSHHQHVPNHHSHTSSLPLSKPQADDNHEGLCVLGCALEPGHGPSLLGPRCPQGAPCGK